MKFNIDVMVFLVLNITTMIKNIILIIASLMPVISISASTNTKTEVPKKYEDFIDYKNSQIIYQEEAAKSICGQHIPLVTTYSINGCIFIILYDSEQKIAITAHWDEYIKPSEVDVLFKKLEEEGSNLDNVEVYLIGGWKYPAGYPNGLGWEPSGKTLEEALKDKKVGFLDTEHLYEKSPWIGSAEELQYISKMMPLELEKYYFFGISFDVCSGTLKLTDVYGFPEKKYRKNPNVCPNEYDPKVPDSGCKLRFINPRKINKSKDL